MTELQKETPSDSSTAANLVELEGVEHSSSRGLASRLYRYEKAKGRSLSMAKYLHAIAGTGNKSNPAAAMSGRLNVCADLLIFHDYYTVDKVTLHYAHFCKVHQLCPFCAIRRGSKLISSYLPVYEMLLQENPTWTPYLITLTVKNGPDLAERFEVLKNAHRRLQDRRRNQKASGKGKTVWSAVEAVVGAFEVTNKGNGWHPHIHLVALCSRPMPLVEIEGKLRCPDLEREWQEITGDSFIVDVRPFGENQTAQKSFCEVFKYALKFSELSHADNWHAYKLLQGKRMIFSYGAFRGVQVPDDLVDDETPLEGLPYIELFYGYLPSVGYNLVSYEQGQANWERKPFRRCKVAGQPLKPLPVLPGQSDLG